MTETPPAYRPGVCNIGGRERRRRYRYAAVCAVTAAVYAAAVLALSAPTALLLGLFVPLSLGVEFLLQARRSFCARLGFRGRFDLREDGSDSRIVGEGGDSEDGGVEGTPGAAGRVSDPDSRRADRRYALRLTVLGVLGGGTGAILAYAVAVALG